MNKIKSSHKQNHSLNLFFHGCPFSCSRLAYSFFNCSSYFLSLAFSARSTSVYFLNFTVSISTGAPRFFFKKSIELFGLSCYSYNPTKARVRLSITPDFYKYFLNYYFLLYVVYKIKDVTYLVAHFNQ